MTTDWTHILRNSAEQREYSKLGLKIRGWVSWLKEIVNDWIA